MILNGEPLQTIYMCIFQLWPLIYVQNPIFLVLNYIYSWNPNNKVLVLKEQKGSSQIPNNFQHRLWLNLCLLHLSSWRYFLVLALSPQLSANQISKEIKIFQLDYVNFISLHLNLFM